MIDNFYNRETSSSTAKHEGVPPHALLPRASQLRP